jgi:predicted nucleotide-binding protein (sugar kinase/HSP70/actin superfamily)
MLELVRAGYENIVCAQPFGCLPNHICGKGMINKIRELYPQANITPIDYDPSATRVNQENRIKLMLAVARERLSEQKIPEPSRRAQAVAERPAPERLRKHRAKAMV